MYKSILSVIAISGGKSNYLDKAELRKNILYIE